MHRMSLLPLLLELESPRASRIVDQQFGHALDPEDLLASLHLSRNPQALLYGLGYYRAWKSAVAQRDSGSTVTVDKDKFEVSLDVQQFTPEEITVKVTGDNVVTIEGKHEEKEDEHGFISRHFVRRYIIPKGHKLDKVESKLSSDGVLTITVPKVTQEQIEERTVPVIQTGKPSKAIEKKEEKNGE